MVALNEKVLIARETSDRNTRMLIKQLLLEAHMSFVLGDENARLYDSFCSYLEEMNYTVYQVDFTRPEQSVGYQPLANVCTTQEILRLAVLIVNEAMEKNTKADPFWDSMAIMLLSAIIGYMKEMKYDGEELNFYEILKLIREGEREFSDSKKSKLSQRFERLKRKNPQSWACSQFENVNQAEHKTYNTIRLTLISKFAKLDTEELRTLMRKNEITFRELNTHKVAIFVKYTPMDKSVDSIVNLFFEQAKQQIL